MQYTTVLLLALGVTSAAGAVNWHLTGVDGKTCVVFAAETITAKLNVLTTDNTTAPITFTIEANQTTVKGNCNEKWQEKPANYLEVIFFPNGKNPAHLTDARDWTLKLWFSQVEGVSFNLADYVLEIPDNDEWKTVQQTFTKSKTADIDVKATGTNGFKCSTTGLSLATTEGATGDSTIDVKDMRVIANARLETPDFPAEQTFEQCLLDSRTSDIVPIVVGACLAGLVAVVLIAYLVGRARAKRQGYASV